MIIGYPIHYHYPPVSKADAVYRQLPQQSKPRTVKQYYSPSPQRIAQYTKSPQSTKSQVKVPAEQKSRPKSLNKKIPFSMSLSQEIVSAGQLKDAPTPSNEIDKLIQKYLGASTGKRIGSLTTNSDLTTHNREASQPSTLITTMFNHPCLQNTSPEQQNCHSYLETYTKAYNISSEKKAKSSNSQESQPHLDLKKKLDDIYDQIHQSSELINIRSPKQHVSPQNKQFTLESPYEKIKGETEPFPGYVEPQIKEEKAEAQPHFSLSSISNEQGTEISKQPEMFSAESPDEQFLNEGFVETQPQDLQSGPINILDEIPDQPFQLILESQVPNRKLSQDLSVIDEEEELKNLPSQESASKSERQPQTEPYNENPLLNRLNNMLTNLDSQLSQSKITAQQARKIEEIKQRHGPKKQVFQDINPCEQFQDFQDNQFEESKVVEQQNPALSEQSQSITIIKTSPIERTFTSVGKTLEIFRGLLVGILLLMISFQLVMITRN